MKCGEAIGLFGRIFCLRIVCCIFGFLALLATAGIGPFSAPAFAEPTPAESSGKTELAAPETPSMPRPLGEPGATEVPSPQVATIEIAARPVLLLGGATTWDKGFDTIREKIATIEGELKAAGLTQAGHPLAKFTETDEKGFKFEAMVPITEKPQGEAHLGNAVQFGESPSGKALKFQHRDAYDSIDSTYDLITTYLDEKNLEAQNLFIEEYLTDLKAEDDPSLEVDIYVFVK